MGRLQVMARHLPQLKADDLRDLGAALFGERTSVSADPVVRKMRALQDEAAELWRQW